MFLHIFVFSLLLFSACSKTLVGTSYTSFSHSLHESLHFLCSISQDVCTSSLEVLVSDRKQNFNSFIPKILHLISPDHQILLKTHADSRSFIPVITLNSKIAASFNSSFPCFLSSSLLPNSSISSCSESNLIVDDFSYLFINPFDTKSVVEVLNILINEPNLIEKIEMKFFNSINSSESVLLPDFGFTLAKKSTDYKISIENLEESSFPHWFSTENLTRTNDDKVLQFPTVTVHDVDRVKFVWKMIETVKNSGNSLKILQDVSNNFPKFVNLFSSSPFDFSKFQNLIQESHSIRSKFSLENSIWIDGIQISPDLYSLYGLLNVINSKFDTKISLMNSLNVTNSSIFSKFSPKFSANLKVPSTIPLWVNDLRSFKGKYGYTTDVNSLTSQNNQILAQNLINLIFICDPLSSSCLSSISIVPQLLKSGLPLRVGFIFITKDSQSELIALKLMSLIKSNVERGAMAAYHLSSIIDDRSRVFTSSGSITTFVDSNLFGNIAINENSRKKLEMFKNFKQKFGLSSNSFFINGDLFKSVDQNHQILVQNLLTEFDRIKELVSNSKLSNDNVDQFISNFYLKNSSPTLFFSEAFFFNENTQNISVSSSNFDANFLKSFNFVGQNFGFTVPLFVSNLPSNTIFSLIDSEFVSVSLNNSTSLHSALSCLQSLNLIDFVVSDPSFRACNWDDFSNNCLTTLSSLLTSQDHSRFNQCFERSFKNNIDNSSAFIIFIDKLFEIKSFDGSDFENLLNSMLEFSENLIKNALFANISTFNPLHNHKILKELFALETSTDLSFLTSSSLTIKSNNDFLIDIVAVIDPLSTESRKIISILTYLDSVGFRVGLSLIPSSSYPSEPLLFSSYFQYSTPDSKLLSFPSPTNVLMSGSISQPPNWILTTQLASHDLDNIYLAENSTGFFDFGLSAVVLHGHVYDENNAPVYGLQFRVVEKSGKRVLFDTSSMYNHGYFQLQCRDFELDDVIVSSSSSSKSISLLSADSVYQLDYLGGKTDQKYVFFDSSFEPKWTTFAPFPVVLKVAITEVQQPRKFSLFKKKSFEVNDPCTHIFTLASGHNYERMVKILTLSVLNHTETPIKFWLLGTFVSPTFRLEFDKLSKVLNFSYAFVDYQWPYWLNKQSQKHRTMWAYKVLFLDVLFPLNVQRIIFMDADQVARYDVSKIAETDLQGSVYGLTPFCDDKPEMQGYAFWTDKKGYWYNHLKGRPYHISAFYVVDLHTFRSQNVGDVLRSVYQRLSADPNSLGNLDQDLLNVVNGEGSINIFSLPRNTLWCESWCSDSSKSKAKVIDLCNNPATKEDKIESAKRIIPKWVSLDSIADEFVHKRRENWSSSTTQFYSKRTKSVRFIPDEL
ncbi:hypothetical protein RCL1_001706 [Eukaryota sp. TZLM3-RCL]